MKLKIKDGVNLEELGFTRKDGNLVWKDNFGLFVHEITRELYQDVINPNKSLGRIFELTKIGVVEEYNEVI